MRPFLLGMIAMGLAVAGLFFLRFWRETRDRFFALFALALFVLALNRVGLVFMVERQMKGDYLYWVRFFAFVIIIIAIIDKNRSRNTAK